MKRHTRRLGVISCQLLQLPLFRLVQAGDTAGPLVDGAAAALAPAPAVHVGARKTGPPCNRRLVILRQVPRNLAIGGVVIQIFDFPVF